MKLDTKKRFGKSEDDIMALVDAKVSRATSWVDTQLSTERARVQRYYDGELPARQHQGSSSYTSSDVYDGVESMKAQLLEVFAGGHDIIRFKPTNDDDVDATRMETSYVSYQVYDKNHAFATFGDCIDDALKNRNGVVQVYWDERIERDEHTFSGMSFEDVQSLVAQEDVEIEADLEDPEAMTYSGVWTRIVDNSCLVIENVPPEEYFSEGSKKRRQDGVRGRKVLKTRAELVREGYDKDKVADLPTENELQLSSERQTREEQLTDGFISNTPVQSELETVMLYETFIPLALRGDGRAALYRVVHCGGVLFEIDEVEEDNFVEFVALRRPHSQFGNNFAKKIIPTQNARTVLTRAILDHTATTVNPRWQVLSNALTNPRELLDNRLRGLINVKVKDGVTPLQYPNLNPFVFQTLETLKANKEENTGISSLSQGLNKDAISSQNSQGLVSDLVTLSQTRQKIIARNFAAFLCDLFLKARKLILENEKRSRVFRFDNSFQRVDPRKWTPTREVQVSLNVGYGEQEKEAARYAQLWGMLTSDPKASNFCPPEKQYALLKDGMKKNGFANFADYVITPDQVKPPGPDPLKIKELEIEQTKAEAAKLTAQAAMAKAESHHQIEEMRAQIAVMMAEIKRFVAERDADRKDMDIANKINVSQREVELAEAVPPENQKGIFSAN